MVRKKEEKWVSHVLNWKIYISISFAWYVVPLLVMFDLIFAISMAY